MIKHGFLLYNIVDESGTIGYGIYDIYRRRVFKASKEDTYKVLEMGIKINGLYISDGDIKHINNRFNMYPYLLVGENKFINNKKVIYKRIGMTIYLTLDVYGNKEVYNKKEMIEMIESNQIANAIIRDTKNDLTIGVYGGLDSSDDKIVDSRMTLKGGYATIVKGRVEDGLAVFVNIAEKIGVEAYRYRRSEDNKIIGKLVIPKNIRYIDKRAFAMQSEIRTLVINGEIEYIGDNAFFGCDNVEKIIYKNGGCIYKSARKEISRHLHFA